MVEGCGFKVSRGKAFLFGGEVIIHVVCVLEGLLGQV